MIDDQLQTNAKADHGSSIESTVLSTDSPCEDVDENNATLSKNQRKRLLKAEYLQEKKKVRKQLEKEKKKIKKQKLKQDKSNDHSTSTSVAILSKTESNSTNVNESFDSTQPQPVKLSREQFKQNYLASCQNNYSIIIDCSFEDCHNETDFKSLGQQIAFSYGYNRKHSHPCDLYLTGMGPKLIKQLSKSSYQNWLGIHHTTNCYTSYDNFIINDNDNDNNIISTVNSNSSSCNNTMPSNSTTHSTSLTTTTATTTTPNTTTTTTTTTATTTTITNNNNNNNNNLTTRRKKLVYLTSDSDNILESLDINTAYIIGGIVDRNKFKGITYEKARQQGIQTAKLPIKEYFQMAATHILTINHVFEIVLQWNIFKDWKVILGQIIPARKELKLLLTDRSNNGHEYNTDTSEKNNNTDNNNNSKDNNIDVENNNNSSSNNSLDEPTSE